MAKNSNIKEEVLELVWTRKEMGGLSREDFLENKNPKITLQLLEEMIREGYLFDIKEEINLGDKGKEIASHLVRAHRLSERLFCDVLDMSEKFMETNACTFEHILSPEVMESICILLGHPRECPHGRPIPQGICCQKAVKQPEKIVLPLSELKSGQRARVVYVTTKQHTRLDHLINLGVFPGADVLVHQTFPSFMIKVGETDIAIDNEIVKDIYVRRK